MSQTGTAKPDPFSAFVTQLEAEAIAVKDKIVALAAEFLPAVATGVEVLLEDLAGMALNAVLTEAPKAIRGSEKFGNAVDNVVQTVEANGKTILQQTAQTAVQAAFLKAQQIAIAAKPAS